MPRSVEGREEGRAEQLARKAREAFEEAADEAHMRVTGSGLRRGPGPRRKPAARS
jgi:hypothetical protein